MTDKHPSNMSLGELERLPVVNVVWQPMGNFTDLNGTSWDVGRWGVNWAKARSPGAKELPAIPRHP